MREELINNEAFRREGILTMPKEKILQFFKIKLKISECLLYYRWGREEYTASCEMCLSNLASSLRTIMTSKYNSSK